MTPDLTQKIIGKLASTLTFICNNPLVFVSETDIHAVVMSELMQIEGLRYTDLYDTDCSIGLNDIDQPSNTKYKTMRIHKEYGHWDRDYARTDIVILEAEEIKKIKDPLNLKLDFTKVSYIVPEFLIEFGTEKAAGTHERFEQHLVSDISKAKKSKKLGFIIHIHRNNVGKNGLEKNKKKFEKYLEALIKASKDIPNNIRLLVIIIEIGNEMRKIRNAGKVKIFRNDRFERVNKNTIEKSINQIIGVIL